MVHLTKSVLRVGASFLGCQVKPSGSLVLVFWNNPSVIECRRNRVLSFALRMSRRFVKPMSSKDLIGRHSDSFAVHHGQEILCRRIVLVGGFSNPLRGHRFIFWNADYSLHVQHSKQELRA